MQAKITLVLIFQFFLSLGLIAQPLSAAYFNDGASQNNISETNTAGSRTTFTVDETCETLRLSVTDPTGDPVGTNKPYTYRTRDANGDQVLDFTGSVNATFRVRSAAAVDLAVQFISGGGASDERTVRLTETIPGDLDNWTTVTFTFDPNSDYLANFDPANIKELFFLLDRTVENFAGNEFYIDHIAVGGLPDAGLSSPCPLPGEGAALSTNDLSAAAPQLVKTSGTAFSRSLVERNDDCEFLTIRVADPDNNPLPAQNAYQLIVNDGMGGTIDDVTNNVNVTLSVQSREEVNVQVLFRSGNSANDERTTRKEVVVPGGLDDWTEITFAFTAADFDNGSNPAFDPTDLRDIWLYLDRGALNFAGNLFVIDDVTVGGLRDEATTPTSPCPLPVASLPLTWADFRGRVEKQEVKLDWATSREENTSHFEVERSYDGRAFVTVGRVASAGFSEELRTYDFTDAAAAAGTLYYRLRQVDLDGAFTFSPVVQLRLEAGARPALYPNPATDRVTISGTGQAAYELRDLNGRVLRTGTLTGDLDVSGLRTGQYVLRVNGASYRFVKR